MSAPSRVVILGGGISGLSAAYFLANALPKIKITLLESSERWGGWIRSSREGDQGVLFERGPHTLRCNGAGGYVLIDTISRLNLLPELITVPKTQPAAKNRFIYHSGRLNQLPTSPLSLLFDRSPALKGLITGALREPFVSRISDDVEDESVYDFVSRRFNDNIASNLISAVMHGIYAGDARELSVRATMPYLWDAEKVYGSVLLGMIRGGLETYREKGIKWRARRENFDLYEHMDKVSMFSFKNGVESLPQALVKALSQMPNVKMETNQHVLQLMFENDRVRLMLSSNELEADHVISALPSPALHQLLTGTTPLPHLTHNPSVNVGVVNLAYSSGEVPDGFGFLVPELFIQESKGVLGIIFDSRALPEQDERPITKLTVMIGGARLPHAFPGQDPSTITKQQLLELATDTVKQTLGIQAPPVLSAVGMQQGCIPQYQVGHIGRMQELHRAMQSTTGHRLSVTGSSYNGIGIKDCVLASWTLVEDLCKFGALASQPSFVVTGLNVLEDQSLERFAVGAK
ncbi:uncharacterized protein VTP21DRAFT_378 [Calcarisporiella thermophila]|uniref:uncharacterized protein n=1 Tax=Calcarisporiella thermophila TaxID=911321 RepID=UPI0037427394